MRRAKKKQFIFVVLLPTVCGIITHLSRDPVTLQLYGQTSSIYEIGGKVPLGIPISEIPKYVLCLGESVL